MNPGKKIGKKNQETKDIYIYIDIGKRHTCVVCPLTAHGLFLPSTKCELPCAARSTGLLYGMDIQVVEYAIITVASKTEKICR